MKGLSALAVVAVLAAATPAAQARTELSVMTWNVCAGTNGNCGLYRASVDELARSVGRYAVDQPIKPDVIFLQEFCTGADRPLELWLERRTGRRWSIRSWGLVSGTGAPYACHPDRLGRPRGAQSVAVAVASDSVTFESSPLTGPPWYVTRGVVCATIPARRVRACGTHLSSGERYDDRQPGAPFRTRQIRELMDHATRPGHWTIFGGDLNVSPPDSGSGSAAGRRAIVPAYRTYQECDQNGPGRTGRWTHRDRGGQKKLDYLFFPKGAARSCLLAPPTAQSDHRPLLLKVTL